MKEVPWETMVIETPFLQITSENKRGLTCGFEDDDEPGSLFLLLGLTIVE